MDKKKGTLNVSVSLLSRVVLLFAALYVRRILIRYIGNDVNGLNSLYVSIIGMLSISELGVGSAIVFSMYKPIVSGNTRQVSALYCLYKKYYKIVGGVILGSGILIMPFLPALIGDYETLSVNVYETFFLTLISVVISYFYSAKSSLIEAHKDNYITTIILTVSQLVRFGLQIVAILCWKSYIIYLVCQIIETILIWILTEVVIAQKYKRLTILRESIDSDTKTEVNRNIRAMFMHKIGSVLVNTVDSIIISGFIGVVAVGKYSNYNVIAGVVAGIIARFFSPLTSVVGHLCAEGNSDEIRHYYYRFYYLNYCLGVVFFLGYFSVIDSVVAFCFGTGVEVSRPIVFIISLNHFTKFMRMTTLLFRDASGAFYNDRWKPIAEGVVNLILSLVFVNLFPTDYRIVGVIVATIITTLFICHIVEPYVVFRKLFGHSPGRFYLTNYIYTVLFTVGLFLLERLMHHFDNFLVSILMNGMMSMAVSLFLFASLTMTDRGFRNEVKKYLNALLGRRRR